MGSREEPAGIVTGSYLGRVIYPIFRGHFGCRRMLALLETPALATYKGGEIGFFVKSLIGNEKSYAVEVNSGNNQVATGQKALENKMVDYLLMLKGNTNGGTNGLMYTIPVYLFPNSVLIYSHESER